MTLRHCLLAAAIAVAAVATTHAEEPKSKYRTAQAIIDASPASDWRTLDPANTLYMELESGRVIIELAPAFAPEHVGNIRTLAHEGFWNGLPIYRSQDNWVVQFGDPTEDEAKRKSLGTAKKKLPAEFERKAAGLKFDALPDADGWAPQVGFVDGFPAGRDPKSGQAWMAHCYGTLGAGRDNAPDSSNGTELYVTIGQSPRVLDRNITVVGRVVKGMELLSTIARSSAPMGMYADAKEYTPIRAIRLASDVPEADRTPLELLRTDSQTFRDATEARRNRHDGWTVRPAGYIDLCNVALPVRTPKG